MWGEWLESVVICTEFVCLRCVKQYFYGVSGGSGVYRKKSIIIICIDEWGRKTC